MKKQKSPIEQIVQEEKRKPKNILFVCLKNIIRSRTAEMVFRQMLKEEEYSVADAKNKRTGKDYEFLVSSAGTDVEKGLTKKYCKQLDWKEGDSAYIIFTFDEGLEYKLIHRFFQPKEKIINLDIPEDYRIDNDSDRDTLRTILREKLVRYIPLP